jgi:hypothetical protein
MMLYISYQVTEGDLLKLKVLSETKNKKEKRNLLKNKQFMINKVAQKKRCFG